MDTMPLSGKEYAALQSLFAAISHLQVLLPTLEKRAKMRPNLWRDIRLVESLVDRITNQIITTVPQDKLKHVSADIRNVRLYIRVEPPGLHSMGTDGFSYTPTSVINQLLAYVCEHECLMCDKSPRDARKCEYRRLIDAALPHEVDTRDGEHCKYSDMVIGIEEGETA